MNPRNLLKGQFQAIGIVSIIILAVISGAFKIVNQTPAWFVIIDYVLTYAILLLLVLNQRKDLQGNNIDSFSLILLLVYRTPDLYSQLTSFTKGVLIFVSLLLGIGFLIAFLRKKDNGIARLSIRQILLYLLGMAVGLGIAMVKIKVGHLDLLTEAFMHPLALLNSITFALSLSAIGEEFIYRGLLWGHLRRRGVNEYLILLLTSLIWTATHINAYSDFAGLINLFFLGLVLGAFTKFTKSIDAAIATHAGYSSFLIMQAMLGVG